MSNLTISPPTPPEPPQIATIHISSMSSNPLLPLQFPTPASLADLHDHLASDALRHLTHHDTPRILVARVKSDADVENDDTGGERVISFVKWDIIRHRAQPRSQAINPPPPPPHPPAAHDA
ncbi:hypothetical protein BDP81DRAFT_449144 [Colletotrichum phormii]|uniref:Uncharacterized protein n=1 Tax=Colletotrichum phormii TaxID=359342 RepID=A0AAI9ZSH4_9PEZI|nr:uncharacterized protein BDP81DRAFT_449144 [Colletotrichum phormii]KAK1637041.1 hypothetical protein BDP81DRAFT_449144 [Colletotrichum phormii]